MIARQVVRGGEAVPAATDDDDVVAILEPLGLRGTCAVPGGVSRKRISAGDGASNRELHESKLCCTRITYPSRGVQVRLHKR